MSVFVRQISGFAAWSALLSALIALSIVASAHIVSSPRLAAWADTISPITVHFVIGGAGAALAVMISRATLPILCSTIVIALLLHAATHFSQQTSAPWSKTTHVSAPALRVYAHNTWDQHPDLQQLETALQAVDADVLVLIEVDPAKQGLLDRLALRYPYKASCAHRVDCATAILSRFPVEAGGADRPNANTPAIAWARINAAPKGFGQVTIVGTHVHRPTRDPARHRRQMLALTGMLLRIDGPMIVAGDFNAGPWSAAFSDFVVTTRLKPANALLPTWPMVPVALPQFAIDHILVSADIAVLRSGAGAATGSDHAPLFAEVGLKRPSFRPEEKVAELQPAP